MARPTTKNDLLLSANECYVKLAELIGLMNEEELNATFAFEDRDRNVRDVLMHLYEWHQLMLDFVGNNQSGDPIPFLPAPYNWRTYSQMNIEIWKKHQNTPIEEATRLVDESHREVMSLIERFSNEELFAAKHFSWTGNSSLGAYFVSSTSSHYEWAIKKIKKHKKGGSK